MFQNIKNKLFNFYLIFILILFLWFTNLNLSFQISNYLISSPSSHSSSSSSSSPSSPSYFYSSSSSRSSSSHSASSSHSHSSSSFSSFFYFYNICYYNFLFYSKNNKNEIYCLNLQYQKCNKIFENSLKKEIQRNNFILNQNYQIQINSTLFYNSCQSNLINTLDSLIFWINQNSLTSSSPTSSIPFQPSCSNSNRLKVLNLLNTNGDSSSSISTSSSKQANNPSKIKKKNINNAKKLFKSTSQIIQSLESYSQEFSQYNIDYINNHTSISPIKVSRLIKHISTPFLNNLLQNEIKLVVQKLTSILNSLVACVGLNPSLSGKCSLLPTSVLSQYLKYQTLINGNFLQIKNEFNFISNMIIDYGNSVTLALKQADDFYDTVIGKCY